MIDLPTTAQINAISDAEAIRALCDDVERTVIQIESQLEFDIGDDEWAKRASNALALFRYTERALKRRLHKLTHQETERRRVVQRPEEDNHPLTRRATEDAAVVDPDALDDGNAIDEAAALLVDYINAVEADRADEVSRAAGDRDEGFLARSNGALRTLKSLRMRLQTRKATLAKAAKEAAQAERNSSRQQQFIDAARAMLPPDTFRAIWDRVFVQEAA